MHFDWQTIATGIGGAVLGIGAVGTFLGKYLPVAKKYIGMASDALNLVDSVLDAVEKDGDGKITISQDELTRIQIAAVRLRDDLKK